MENGLSMDVNLLDQIKKEFLLGEQDINSYSPLVLAYIGDCVYELIVRTVLVSRQNCAVQKMHREATWYVKAATQAKVVTMLMEELTEEEAAVYRRGRNAKSHTIPAKLCKEILQLLIDFFNNIIIIY